jgi:hypothetical protein
MMQNLISSLPHFFTPDSRPGDKYVEKNSRHAPKVKSLQTGKSLPETCALSEIRSRSPQKINCAARSGDHHSDATPPTYRASMGHLEETPKITADVFFQHINHNEINLLQSAIEAGFQCDATYAVNGKSITPFQYAMWQGNADALKVLLPHTSRNHIVLAFLRAHEEASLQELDKILPAAKEVLTTLGSQPEMKYPWAQCANFIERIEARFR